MKVAHFIRKKSQLDSSFIYNQILCHQDAVPVIICGYHDKEEGNIDFPPALFPLYILNIKEGLLGPILWALFYKLSNKKSKLLNEIIEREKPDILHFHYGSDAGIFMPAIRNLKIPSLVSFYGYDSSGFPKYYFGLGKWYLRQRVFSICTMITAMSAYMKRDIVRTGCKTEKIAIHYHGINTDLFRYENKYPAAEIVRFLMISSFAPQKGHIFLLKAFQMALETTNNIELTVIGFGKPGRKLAKLINGVKSDRILFRKPVRYASEEHLNSLLDADVFIHPSVTDSKGNKEGIPGSIIEAMCTGLPVISTFHAGIPEIIDHMKNGYLVEENHLAGLCEAIITLARKKELRIALGQAAKEFVRSELNISVKERELEDLYRQMLSHS